ncbi:hypothetical protein O181_099155, partial [Austropuccinia psidii MF-1]|nr:hypothetical protein [Austropuccinia psidii MF-1]
MSYSEKEALKQIPKASSWRKFSDVQSIPDYWITARLHEELKGHAPGRILRQSSAIDFTSHRFQYKILLQS